MMQDSVEKGGKGWGEGTPRLHHLELPAQNHHQARENISQLQISH